MKEYAHNCGTEIYLLNAQVPKWEMFRKDAGSHDEKFWI